MQTEKRHQLTKDIQQLDLATMSLMKKFSEGKDIDKVKELSLTISGLATGIQIALSTETSL